MRKFLLTVLLAAGLAGATSAAARMRANGFAPTPRAAAEILGVAKGRPVATGLVFIDGDYLAPPYAVDRYGTVLRVNSHPVSGEVVAWTEFLKTQTPPEEKGASAPEAKAAEGADSPAGDGGETADGKAEDSAAKPAEGPAFEMNAAAKALLAQVDAAREGLERALLAGGLRCFSAAYPAFAGDGAEASRLLGYLPTALKEHEDFESFASAMRGEGFGAIPEAVLRDLHAHRLGYPRLAVRRKKARDSRRERANPSAAAGEAGE